MYTIVVRLDLGKNRLNILSNVTFGPCLFNDKIALDTFVYLILSTYTKLIFIFKMS